MKIFVTGGTGFIGSHLVKSLIKDNYDVTVYDNFSTSKDNLKSNIKNSADLIKGDIRDFDFIVDSLKGSECVIHLAAKISVQESISNPSETFDVNVNGTKNLLDACKKNNVSKFITTSTAAVYGRCDRLPISEDHPLQPISPYGQSKLEMENMLKSYSKKHNLDSIILRPFNVYGRSQSKEYAGVISKFIENIQQNKPLVIYGDGSFTRDFVHIDDVVTAFTLSISHIQAKRAETYNIATGQKTSINSIAKMMLDISGKELDIIYKPSKEGDIPHSQADITKAKKELEYFPKINLQNGLKDLLDQISE